MKLDFAVVSIIGTFAEFYKSHDNGLNKPASEGAYLTIEFL